MKVNYAIMGSTEDPNYLDFWPVVSQVWRKKFNIIPILGVICDEDSDFYESSFGLIKKIKKVDNYSAAMQSQLVRLFLPQFLNGNSIVSDIDMIPLSKKYFIDDLLEYSDNDILIMSSHHPQTKYIKQYPMCYVIANQENFKKVFNLQNDWHHFLKQIPQYGWFTDQIFLYKSINEKKDGNVKFPFRDFEKDMRRIDRGDWNYDSDLVKENYYIDSHLLRPYIDNKIEIDKLINLIID